MTAPAEEPVPAPADAVKEMRSSTTINGNVIMGTGSTIGLANGTTPGVTHRLQGTVPANVINEACATYARPDCYDLALKTLKENQIVVLYGDPETGRRTGAINLMRDLDEDRPLVMLLPDQSLKELAERDYAENTSYLLFGWSGEDADSDGGDVGAGAMVEKVRLHPSTHLIITSERRISALVPHVPWCRPSLAGLMAAHGVRDVPVEEAALGEYGLADLVRFAKDLAKGVDPETSLGTLDLADRRKVATWFEGRRVHRDILEVAALVFLDGVAENVFEPWFERLADEAVPAPPEGEPPVSSSPFDQTRMRPADSLVARPRRAAATPDAIPGQLRRYVEFKSPGFRRHMVSELCDRYRLDFWLPLFAGIDQLVRQSDDDTRSRIARGLSLLAERDFDSVRAHFLQPWSNGSRGWRAWATAVHALGFMCLDDSAAPLARRTAIRWSRSNDVVRRCAAAYAFSGAVGVLYPGDAMRQLWALSDREETADAAATAIMLLYVTLNESGTGDDTVVLRSLLSRLTWAVRADLRRFGTTADIMIGVLSARMEGRQVTAAHLRDHPEDASLLGQLCALTVVNRPRRTAVFGTLHDVLGETGDDEDVRRAVLARIRAMLPAHERRLFVTQFAAYAKAREPASGLLPLLFSTFDSEQR